MDAARVLRFEVSIVGELFERRTEALSGEVTGLTEEPSHQWPPSGLHAIFVGVVVITAAACRFVQPGAGALSGWAMAVFFCCPE